MRIVKVKIKNMFGITEYEGNGNSVELIGKNGAGKSSVIDAIRYALTNKASRKYIIRNGANEGEVIVETDTGIRIDRKARKGQADYKSIKQDGREVGSPESFLRDIFTNLQLNPVEFLSMDEKKQNSIILDMIEYKWDLQKIKDWFGEIPTFVNYEQNILQILNDIQSENGDYFKNRQDVNRDIRNKKAFVEEIAASIPANYDVEKWENANVGEIYQRIERIRKDNEVIERAKRMLDGYENKVRSFEAEKEIQTSALDQEMKSEEMRISNEITKMKEQIFSLEKEKESLSSKKADKLAVIQEKYNASVAKFEAEIQEYKPFAEKEIQDYSALAEEARNIEEMKAHINEYRRMRRLQQDIEELKKESDEYTRKIEKARALPGEILGTCTIPIKGLTVEDGIPLINGLPVSNLSDGQKLDLCIDVAIQNPKGLQIILIDGVEKLSTQLRTELYQKCKNKGLQFIATRTTDDEDLTVIEL